ncbi:MAG: hypothetical protein IPM56_10420 [Ignavibacteriales bacterium]|nr:MAG: hypothetical protein IPM56_10420 [Ignavibacteriales bacterium]
MDSLLYSKILPAKFDSSVSPIFINTTNGWLNFEKEVETIKNVTSLMRYEFPYLNGVDFRSGTVEHRVEIIDKDLFNIYTTHDFANPMMTKDFVIHNDSLVIKAERFEKVVKLNSGVFGYIISDVEWYFGEYRSGYCGGCMYSNDYLVTYQDLKLKKSNKLLLLHLDEFRARGVITFYKDMEIYLIEEGEDYPVNYNNFKNNIFTMKFSENKVVKIKIDEEKWRLIFIKNW